ncbi:MAG TPA: hypothetical protein VIY10_06505, partial [Solirubrobacteraceae bacterium]
MEGAQRPDMVAFPPEEQTEAVSSHRIPSFISALVGLHGAAQIALLLEQGAEVVGPNGVTA